MNSEKNMQELFAKQWGICKYTPHFVSDRFCLSIFYRLFNLYNISQCNYQMFLEIMETRFLYFFIFDHVFFISDSE